MSISQLPVGNSHFRGDQYMLSCMGPQGGQQGGYQRPGSAQALGSRHSMQVRQIGTDLHSKNRLSRNGSWIHFIGVFSAVAVPRAS